MIEILLLFVCVWQSLGSNSGCPATSIFRKFVEKIQGSRKSDKNNGYVKRRPMYILISHHFFLEREMFHTEVIQETETHILL